MVMPAQTEQIAVSGVTGPVSERIPTVVAAPNAADPEMKAQRTPLKRRSFTAKEKLRVLAETDAAVGTGEIGSILRREGLYSSVLHRWRQQRDQGIISSLAPSKRGPCKSPPFAADFEENKQLRHENSVLRERLVRAETIIDFQKKVSELLAIPLKPQSSDNSD